ncbi:MAG: hypothetical protein M3409_07560 [Gemmatimonadota bacterium]|nr:hypothetical protein [Gemmatimonadota bacterium]
MVDTSRLMVSVSGLRGRVGHGLTPEILAHFAAAFGAYSLGRGRPAGRPPPTTWWT